MPDDLIAAAGQAALAAEGSPQAEVSEGQQVTPEAQPTTGETSVQPQEAPQTQEEQMFFDASKVEPALKPTLQAMQAAWTQKIQEEVVPYRQLTEQYGGVEEIREFLDQFQTPEGILDWWVTVAQEGLGLSEEQVNSLFGGQQGQQGELTQQPQGQQPQGFDPNDPNRPMTLAEFQAWQAQQAEQARTFQEDNEVENLVSKLDVPDDQKPLVVFLASQQPANLGYAKRLELGLQQYKQTINQQATQAREEQSRVNAGAPVSLSSGGNIPSVTSDTPRTIEDASKAAREWMGSQ